MPGDEPQPVLEPSAAASIDAPLFNPDALMTQPTPSQNILESSVPAFMDAQLRTAEAPTAGVPVDTAMGAEQQVQEFQGELMTFNDAKGWERVALVQSRGWPEGVPVPQCAPSPTEAYLQLVASYSDCPSRFTRCWPHIPQFTGRKMKRKKVMCSFDQVFFRRMYCTLHTLHM